MELNSPERVSPFRRRALRLVIRTTSRSGWISGLSAAATVLAGLSSAFADSNAADGQVGPEPVVKAEFFALSRSRPTFTVEVFANGNVKWVGFQRVRTVGSATLAIDSRYVRKLLEDFDRIGFRNLESQYKVPPGISTGMFPGPVYTVNTSTFRHRVEFFGGAGSNFSDALYEALNTYVPVQGLRCPYIARFPDHDAGYEICSGRQIYTDREMIEMEERK